MTKYIAYCRKSTDEPDKQVLSIDAQVEELKEFAVKENLDILCFLTEAKTAKQPGREKFEQMLKLIEKGEANGILSWNPDRLARNSIDGGKIIYLLDRGKLQSLKFPSFWFENTPQGRFMLNIAFGEAKYFVDNLSVNVKRGIRQKLRNGVYPNKAPIGYLNEPRKRTVEVDPKTAHVVKRAFRLFSTGNYSFSAIQKYFFEKGLKGKTRRLPHLDKIRMMLRNPFYYGVIKFTGEIYQGSHKPLISKTLFDKCQEFTKKRAKLLGNNKNDFAFLGLARCKECGSAITAEKHFKYYPRTRGRVRYDYYRCGKNHGSCSQKYIPAFDFEEKIREIVFNYSLHEANAKWLLNKLKEDGEIEKRSTFAKTQTLKSQINLLDKKLERLLEAYLNQVIDTNEYQMVKKKLIEEKLDLEEKITQIKKNGCDWIELVEEFINSALEAHKIAAAKNNCHLLSQMAKKVGSNYFLESRHLEFSQSGGFRALAAEAGAASAPLPLPKLCRVPDSNR
ncbi:recombinase family protein [Candidatus Gottesmanbacteria bacterium]|nr:recombinase family protein [Candidatus Gottesmanbacteria bacterium]